MLPASGHRRLRVLAAVGAVIAGVALPLTLAAGPASAHPSASGSSDVVDLPISFTVRNQNRTGPFPGCPVDNAEYTVRGHLTGPADRLSGDTVDAGTLYVHGHSYSEELWRYKHVDGLDWTGDMARRGHVSVTYDRLGYESSGKPEGHASCYTSEADVMSQIVDDLKSGDYAVDGRSAPKIGKVAVAGHSQAAIFGEFAAHEFHNFDAYIHMSFATALNTGITRKYAENIADCALDPKTANQEPGAPGGYQFRGRTDADFVSTNYVDADPEVERDTAAKRNVDPCGFPDTAVQTAAVSNNVQRGQITMPVLVMYGEKDPNFVMPVAAIQQAATYTGSKDVHLEILPGAGHTFMLERGADHARTVVSDWLTARGF